jgi:hypothetical protein
MRHPQELVGRAAAARALARPDAARAIATLAESLMPPSAPGSTEAEKTGQAAGAR